MILAAITEGNMQAASPRREDFTPWIGSGTREEIEKLALNKFLRESGYLRERASIPQGKLFTVWTSEDVPGSGTWFVQASTFSVNR